MPGAYPADQRTGMDPDASVNQRCHRLVRGTEPARMIDADHANTGDLPREAHDARAGGVYRVAGASREIDSTVPRQPRQWWWIEPGHDGRPTGERPSVTARVARRDGIGRRLGPRQRDVRQQFPSAQHNAHQRQQRETNPSDHGGDPAEGRSVGRRSAMASVDGEGGMCGEGNRRRWTQGFHPIRSLPRSGRMVEAAPGQYTGEQGRHRGDTVMNESHFIRNALLAIVGVIVVGYIAVWLLHLFFSLFLYIVVGALVVGGGMYLYGRAKRSITGGRRRIGS